MSKRLAELVGNVVLAWGGMEQQLHSLIRMMEQARGEPFTNQRAFARRMVIFRRLCNDLTNGDGAFLSDFDQFRNKLKNLERDRGVIAHGWAGPRKGGSYFVSMRALWSATPTQPPDTPYFSYQELAQLEADIHAAKESMARLCSEAVELHPGP